MTPTYPECGGPLPAGAACRVAPEEYAERVRRWAAAVSATLERALAPSPRST